LKNPRQQTDTICCTASLFFFAGLSGLLFVLFQDLKTGSSWKKKDIIAGICLGIPNFFSIYLIVVLLSDGWQGSILFPMLNVAIILITTLVGLFVFKEDFNRNRKAGIVLAILAIILLSMPWK
ncbi:MAG TPA: EamA family transporter, partial [Saprospiraceae bacterium]|nr:EamA family transporter [Saprospiraceae bacterium]